MEKKTNQMGLDKYQTAAIKRNYQNIKPLLRKVDSLKKKMEELNVQKESLEKEITEVDNYTLNLSKKVTGHVLTSEQVVNFLENPEEWEKFVASQGQEAANQEANEKEGTKEEDQNPFKV
jgi:hypothetical protein